MVVLVLTAIPSLNAKYYKTVPKDIDVDVIENLAVKMEKEGLI